MSISIVFCFKRSYYISVPSYYICNFEPFAFHTQRNLKKYLIYVFESWSCGEEEGEIEIFIQWFTPQMATVAMAESVQAKSRELFQVSHVV